MGVARPTEAEHEGDQAIRKSEHGPARLVTDPDPLCDRAHAQRYLPGRTTCRTAREIEVRDLEAPDRDSSQLISSGLSYCVLSDVIENTGEF